MKPKAPLRTFVWTDEIRTLYGAVVRTKLESIKLYREKITEQEEFMRVNLTAHSPNDQEKGSLFEMNIQYLLKQEIIF